MLKRVEVAVLGLLAFGLMWSGVQRAASQQAGDRKQALIVGYPNPAINIGGTNSRYGGIIYTSVFSAGSAASAAPVATAELGPSQRAVWQLPLGSYEVRFGMRTGSEMKTFIVRDVLLRPEGASTVTVEMNADAKTTIVGGDMSIQEMQDSLRRLRTEAMDLRQEVDQMKKRTGK